MYWESPANQNPNSEKDYSPVSDNRINRRDITSPMSEPIVSYF